MVETLHEPAAISIGDRFVGPGHPIFVVAEIGINHNGDMGLAREMIDAAAEAGADSVKFQNYRTEDFVADRSQTYTYVSQGREITETQYAMFKRCELSRDQVLGLAEYCRKRKIDFHSTPTGADGIKDLLDAGVGVLKNGSDYLSNVTLIRQMGETGLPTVLSTGMAELSEIEDAVRAFRETGNTKLILLHCTSSYPTPDEDVNVVRVRTLQTTFHCLAGFSDHSEGVIASTLSVAFGSCWVEKHFTTDRNLVGPDHRFSMDPAELKALIQSVRTAERQIGTPEIAPTVSEAESRRSFILSCVASENLGTGTVLEEKHVAFGRPGTGLRPARVGQLFGKKLKKAVHQGHVFDMDADFI